MQSNKSRTRCRGSGFTLIELLTVIAIVAILASLLLTAVSSGKKKSRSVVCTFNLHQISLAMDMYLDDFNGKRPGVANLAGEKYLVSPESLLCPEDKTGNWGYLSENSPIFIGGGGGGFITFFTTSFVPESVNYSYLFPMTFNNAAWDSLVDEGGDAGVAACQLHGLGKQDPPDVHNYSGLLLRGQRDGSVVRRQHFWSVSQVPTFTSINWSVVPMGVGGFSIFSDYYLHLQLFVDDPIHVIEATPAQ